MYLRLVLTHATAAFNCTVNELKLNKMRIS